MAGLFISYRRDDSQGFAGRLAQDLSRALGENHVFSDVEIPLGQDFSDVLHGAIAASDALLVVIGRRWAADSAQGHASRLFEPADWVRTEIESAFALGKPVIPVLVGGASMPAPATLPPSLQRLPRLQALPMSDRHWAADLAQLLQHLQALLPGLPRARSVPATLVGTPAQALQEVAQAVLEQMRQAPPGRHPPPASAAGGSRLLRWLAWMAQRLRRWLSLLLLLVAVYWGVRLFGDAALLAQLDGVEARLHTAWQRLQQALAGR